MILVSACLAGVSCRYDGSAKTEEQIVEMVKEGQAIIACPELLGGLKTPRVPCEIKEVKGREEVVDKEGNSYTQAFRQGAEQTLALCLKHNIHQVILLDRSPSCGCHTIYDGTFSGTLIKGAGLTTKLLRENKIKVFTYQEWLMKA